MDNSFLFQGITFLWDIQKAQINRQKHGVTFEQACEVFFDPFIRVVDASAEDEARDAVIGVNSNGKHLFVVHIQLEFEVEVFLQKTSTSKIVSELSRLVR